MFSVVAFLRVVKSQGCVIGNPLPDMPFSGFSNSTGNKDIMSKISTNGDTII